ncbi:glutathione S-transferase family protein [Hwanghaeella sp.]|uniref:glutathione S-transferase family protein n=1 Tax=Hwanghaeella sp. TaxID=2605943 RepID=UPI003CCB7FAB
MKLYDFPLAANAQRVHVFMAEKGLDLERVRVNIRQGEQFAEPFCSMNPFHCVPVLELDDGTVIAESMSICRYLEELHPSPSLFGRTPEKRAVIDMWARRMELDAFIPLLHALRNHAPMFAGRVVPGTNSDLPQVPEIVTRGIDMMQVFLTRLEPHLERNAFLAGEDFSVADITGFFTMRLAGAVGMDISKAFPNTARWHADISARPSFKL